MLRQGLVICVYALLVAAISVQDSLRVNTQQGLVIGYRTSEDVYVFYGIPYATAPTGKLKFRPPLPPPSWTEPLKADERKLVVCPQRFSRKDSKGNNIKMQEDCLIANIFVPDTTEKMLPVVVHVHGGAYQHGFSLDLTPINLVKTKKIISVNFNYRLGAHGFLCVGTKAIPGNAGMKDIVALLRWVQNNIANFGGNPDDVTIHGWSAGASAVDLVMLSKSAKGLFHKVIPDSGASAASFSVQVDPFSTAKYVAKELNFNDVDSLEALEDFYVNAPIASLWSVDVYNSKNSSVIFPPCIERDLGEEMFLDDHPVNIIKSGDYPKVPMLFGIAENEGIYRVDNFERWRVAMSENLSDFFPEDLKFPNEIEKKAVENEVKQFYFGDEPVSEKNILAYVDYFTDVLFSYGIAKGIQLQVEAGNNQVYLYQFGFVDESQSYIIYTNVRGAHHCAQTEAVMDEGDESKLSSANQRIKAVMRDIWYNFITTGKPIPNGSAHPAWPPVGDGGSPYMYINSNLELRSLFLGDRVHLWGEIYSKYFRIPTPPTP